MSTDNNLTVLLALKDRAPFTFRWMRYANHIKFPFKVLIADGGADREVYEVLSNRHNFPNVNYEYIRYPYDETYTEYYAKLVDALERVQTPFVVMADNDDFFVIDGLMRSVEFLRQHSEYSSCRGVIGAVIVEPNPILGELSQVYGTELLFAAHRYPPGPIVDATALQRIQDFFSCYRTTWYDVFRTEQAVQNWQVLKGLDTKDLLVAEYVPQLIGIASGKVYIDSYLYLVRQVKGPGSSSQNESQKKGDPFDRMLLESWSNDITGFIDAIAAAISKKDGIPVDEARMLVRQGYRNYMGPSVVNCFLDQMPRISPLRIALSIVSRVRTAYWLFRSMMSSQPLVGQYVPGRRFVASHGEFGEIYEFLTSSQSPIAVK